MNCRRKSYRLAVVFLILCMFCIMFCGCKDKEQHSNAYRSISAVPMGSQQLASNSEYELNWDDNAGAVVLKSIKTGKVWSDILYDSFLNGSTSANANSPISITVVKSKTLKWETVNSYSVINDSGKGSILCKKIDNGIRVTYFFDNFKIAVPVEYVLNDDYLSVELDTSKILEDGTDYKLVSVSLASFFCSVKNDSENGALFVPTGSGAIMNSAETPSGTRIYKGEVYGVDGARQTPVNLVNEENIKLPVFGAYGDEVGMLGIIENGAGSAEIEAQAGNNKIGYSNIKCTFYVRGYDEFSYIYHGKYNGITQRVDNNISGLKYKVSYYPLYGEQANYNGMAEKYRNYLIDNGVLKKSQLQSASYAVSLLGGTNITHSFFGVPYKKLTPLTTFEEAREILGSLEKNVGILPTVRMTGYGNNGVRPGQIAGGKNYSSVYGSKKDIENLIKKYKNTNIYFDNDIVRFSQSSIGFLKNFDTAKTAILHNSEHFPVTPLRVNDESNPYYIISRDKLLKAGETAVKKSAKYGINSISFSSLGSIAFSDYSQREYVNKNAIETDAVAVFENARNKGMFIATADANSYAACAADVLFDTPVTNGDYDVFDLQIPFYQMVFHSYKTMYSSAVNISDNSSLLTAKSIAFGMGIGYEITNNYIDESDDLEEFPLHATVYDDNLGGIVKTISQNEYQKVYESIKDSVFKSFVIDETGVSKSVFDNGKIIYVNLTGNQVKTDIGKIEAYGFCFIEEGKCEENS